MRERDIEVELTDAARTLLGNLGYDPTYGARPLKRVIQKRLVDQLALAILEGRFVPGDTVMVDAADGELVLERAEVAAPRGRPSKRQISGRGLVPRPVDHVKRATRPARPSAPRRRGAESRCSSPTTRSRTVPDTST